MSEQTPKQFERGYLGDGVYVCFDGHAFGLYTRDGVYAPCEIYLKQETLDALITFAERAKAKEGNNGR